MTRFQSAHELIEEYESQGYAFESISREAIPGDEKLAAETQCPYCGEPWMVAVKLRNDTGEYACVFECFNCHYGMVI